MNFSQNNQPLYPKATSWWIDTLFLCIVLGSLFFIMLGIRPLFTPDEGRYAEIAREMVASGDYVTPYLNSIKYFEKPIFFYWLGALSIKIGGLNIGSLRSINGLLGLIGCLLTYFTARQLYGRKTGLLSALILGTSILYFVMAHTISLDLPVTVFLSATLYACLLGAEEPNTRKSWFFFLAASVAAALAVLTKGLIGIVFPAMIVGAWIILMQEWRLLKPSLLLSCLLIFLIVAAPWHIIVGMRNPEFFYFYFIEQHFLRYATMDIGHYQPIWFFIPCLILGFFPWIVFLPQTICASLPSSFKNLSAKRTELFFLLWAIIIFAFFSFSKSKLIPYILPVIPPLSILTARYLANLQKVSKFFIVSFVALTLIAITIAYTFYLHIQYGILADPIKAKYYLTLAASVLVAGTFITLIISHNKNTSISMLIITMWFFLLIALASIPSIDTRTIRPLAMALKPMLKPQDDVITYNRYYQDLPFYLERRISILNWQNELTFGMQHQQTDDWMINNQTFWQRWHSNRRVYLFLGSDDYQSLQKNHTKETFYLLNKTSNNVLISNQKP